MTLLLLTGCGLFASSQPAQEPVSIRTPKPTFTPTPVQSAPTPATVTEPPATTQSQDAAGTSPSGASGGSSPIAVITGPLVNLRAGPGTDFEIVETVERGAQYDIIGRNAANTWWQICCIDGQNAWVIGEFVDTDGAVDSMAVSGQESDGSTPQADPPDQATQLEPSSTEAPASPTATPAPTTPAVNFTLESQEQFPETGFVRIYLYVNDGNRPLEGYSLRVTKDGQELPVSSLSFGGQPAFTWPFQDPRQRFQNFKAEFPDVAPAGNWEVQLVNADGAPVGPEATFTLSENDPEQELYVRYIRQ